MLHCTRKCEGRIYMYTKINALLDVSYNPVYCTDVSRSNEFFDIHVLGTSGLMDSSNPCFDE